MNLKSVKFKLKGNNFQSILQYNGKKKKAFESKLVLNDN